MKKIFRLFTLLLTVGFMSSCSEDTTSNNVEPAGAKRYYLDAEVVVDAITSRADITFDDEAQMVDIYLKNGDLLKFQQKDGNSIWAGNIDGEFWYRYDAAKNSFWSDEDYSDRLVVGNYYMVAYGWSERTWGLDTRNFEYTQVGDGTTDHMAGLLNLSTVVTWADGENEIRLGHDTSLYCLDIVVPDGVTPKTLVWTDVFKTEWSGDDNRRIVCTFEGVDEVPADGAYTTYFCVLTAQPAGPTHANGVDGRNLTLSLTDTDGVYYERVMLDHSYQHHGQKFYRSTVEFTADDVITASVE